MRLTIEVIPFMHADDHIELRTFFDDGQKKLQIQEIMDRKLCKDKYLMKRMVDRLFYELKGNVYKHFAL